MTTDPRHPPSHRSFMAARGCAPPTETRSSSGPPRSTNSSPRIIPPDRCRRSGAAAVAAVLAGRVPEAANTVAVVSGRNIALRDLAAILAGK